MAEPDDDYYEDDEDAGMDEAASHEYDVGYDEKEEPAPAADPLAEWVQWARSRRLIAPPAAAQAAPSPNTDWAALPLLVLRRVVAAANLSRGDVAAMCCTCRAWAAQRDALLALAAKPFTVVFSFRPLQEPSMWLPDGRLVVWPRTATEEACKEIAAEGLAVYHHDEHDRLLVLNTMAPRHLSTSTSRFNTALLPDGRHIVGDPVGAAMGRWTFYDLGDGLQRLSHAPPTGAYAYGMLSHTALVKPAGAAARAGAAVHKDSSKIMIVDFTTGVTVAEWQHKFELALGHPFYSNDLRTVAFLDRYDEAIFVFDTSTAAWDLVHKLSVETLVMDIVWGASGSTVAVLHSDGQLCLLDAATFTVIKKLRVGRVVDVYSWQEAGCQRGAHLVWSPSERLVAITHARMGDDKQVAISIWDITQGRRLHQFDARDGFCFFSSCGRYVCMKTKKGLMVYGL